MIRPSSLPTRRVAMSTCRRAPRNMRIRIGIRMGMGIRMGICMGMCMGICMCMACAGVVAAG